jgi:hypothetical protein
VIDMTCVRTSFQQAPANLATILDRLRAAAGPRVPIVGMNFYDPFLAAWLQGPAGQALARLSVELVTQYNDLLEVAYQDARVPVADVEDAFATTNFDDLATLPHHRADAGQCGPHLPVDLDVRTASPGAERPRPARRLLGHGRRLPRRPDPGGRIEQQRADEPVGPLAHKADHSSARPASQLT